MADAKGLAVLGASLEGKAGAVEPKVGLLPKGVEAEAKGFENGVGFCTSGAPNGLAGCSEAITVLVNGYEQV